VVRAIFRDRYPVLFALRFGCFKWRSHSVLLQGSSVRGGTDAATSVPFRSYTALNRSLV
jgi:hypothetical protein